MLSWIGALIGCGGLLWVVFEVGRMWERSRPRPLADDWDHHSGRCDF